MAGSNIASLNQLLHFRLMWNYDILGLQQIFALQVRKLWLNSPFATPNMKACSVFAKSETGIKIKKSHTCEESGALLRIYFCLAFIDEFEKQPFIKKTVEVGQ